MRRAAVIKSDIESDTEEKRVSDLRRADSCECSIRFEESAVEIVSRSPAANTAGLGQASGSLAAKKWTGRERTWLTFAQLPCFGGRLWLLKGAEGRWPKCSEPVSLCSINSTAEPVCQASRRPIRTVATGHESTGPPLPVQHQLSRWGTRTVTGHPPGSLPPLYTQV